MATDEVLALILGGGLGTRLFPLTRERCKPAVPLAGKYRLVDISMSNCINSRVHMIYVLTMYQSASLHAHLTNTYRFDHFSRGFCEILAAEQTRERHDWYAGTADAVRQAWRHVSDVRSRHILVLAGDHLYGMNYGSFVAAHEDAGADVTIAVQAVGAAEAPGLGILKLDAGGRITDFVEKPGDGGALARMAGDTTRLGLTAEDAAQRPFVANMGVYLFRTPVLKGVLDEDPRRTDFGRDIIPAILDHLEVRAFPFADYWADIGTVGSFYEANMELVQPLPRFNLFDPEMPIYSAQTFLPGAKLNRAIAEGAMLCEGVIVDRATVRDSILGVRARVRPGATVEGCLVMGADYYQPYWDMDPEIGIGEGACLRRCIVDKNASIGRGAQLVNRDGLQSWDDPEGRLYVRDGVAVVPKNAVIPEGFVF